MNRLQYLLTKLAEESAEVAQCALKCQQFGLHEVQPGQPHTNEQRLHTELNDLLGIVEMLNLEFGFNFIPSEISMMKKQIKVNEFYQYSRQLGSVE